MSLSDKESKFVDEFLKDMNASQAYIRAGYAGKNANVNSSKLMAKYSIQSEVKKRLKESSEKCGISRERTLNAIARIAYNEDGDCSTKEQLDGLEKLAKFDNIYEKNNESSAPKIEIKYVGDE